MKRVFIDTNVIIDVFAKREGYIASHAVLSLSQEGIIRGYISQGSLYTIIYLLEGMNVPDVRAQIMGLTTILRIVSIGNADTFRALQSSFKDAEDALQHATALSINAEAIITRNAKDFRKSRIPVFKPEQFLAQ